MCQYDKGSPTFYCIVTLQTATMNTVGGWDGRTDRQTRANLYVPLISGAIKNFFTLF
jgi:hypothetical protein